MKKKTKIFLISIFIILLSISCIYLINIKINAENNQDEDLINVGENNQQEDLINIAECSQEFMEEYFEKSKKLNEKNNKDNILIVTSKEKIEDTFGASDIVEAPNNQYILQYNSEEEKNTALEQFKNSDDVLYVDENHTYNLFESDYNSWGIEKIGLDSAIQTAEEKNINNLLNDVTVAIIDTGCKMELFNENYSGKIIETYNLYDDLEMYDGNGHGTHISGTIAEGTSSNVHILPVKVSNSAKFDTVRIINAINYITYYKKADVINMSFGSTAFDNSLYVSIEAASKNGIISVAAAGNANTSENSYPAAFDNTISVSAVDSELNLAEFSNYGEKITFSAPGVDIESINGSKSGTSMAAPHVVCAVAMLKSANKSLSLEQSITLLKNTAIDLGDSGWDEYYGYGLINLSNFDDLITEAENTNIEDFEIKNTSKISAIYGNITNLMNLKVILKDVNGNEYNRYLSDLDDLEIENYDPFAKGEQNIKIKYNNIEKTITVDNGNYGGNDSGYTIGIVDEIQSIGSIVNINTQGGEMPKKIYIPEYIDGYKVVSISEGALKDTEIDAIILPSTVTSIGNEAFYNSTIKSLTGGASEISIGDNAFYNTYKLEIFEPKISTLGEYAFYNNSSIKHLTLSDDIESLEAYTFYNCINLEDINIPDKLVEIKDYALSGTKIMNLSIPKTLVSISDTAFRGMTSLETIVVDAENPIYDSRENCNALIETSSNIIKLGASSTTIPDTVCSIASYAFYNNIKIENINTNKVKTINESAFEGCINIKEFYLTETVETLCYHMLYHSQKAIVYMYNMEQYSNFINTLSACGVMGVVVTTPPASVSVLSSEKYRSFDKAEDIEINISYYGMAYTSTGLLNEKITKGYTITYANGGDCFKLGDTYFIVSAITRYGISIEEKVNVSIEKAIPEYVIPTDIIATVGQQLSEIELPEGFEWMDENQIIEDSENAIYKAKYIPKDTTNYEIVENIEIPINLNAYVKYQYVEETNEVIAKIISNVELKDTKPTWKLSEDRKVYTKVFAENIKYTTPVQDINGKITDLEININQIKITQLETNYIYDEEKNEVTAQIISNIELKDTKPTWKLSEDKKIYTKVFTENMEYTTPVQDKWGNIIDANIKVTEVKKLELRTEYEHNSETNQVVAKIISNVVLKDTKPTWKLSEDKKIYTKIYDVNQTYSTIVESINGERVNVEINIDKVDDKGPEISLDYKYNCDNTVTIYLKSNEKLGDTKPTWTLSADKMTYEKNYSTDEEDYTTKVQDIYGNSTDVRIVLKKRCEDLMLGDANVKIAYIYTANNVIVQIISDKEFEDTKPTWKLSEDKKTYTKIYYNYEEYTTSIQFIDGGKYNIKISVI